MASGYSTSGPDGITLHTVADGYIARRADVYPVLARLAPGKEGWGVSLVAVSFEARPIVVATSLPSADAAMQAASTALATVRAVQAQEEYRYRVQEDSTNRWYVDITARSPVPWDGRLPDLHGTDVELSARGFDRALGYLDAQFPELVNLAQHRPHFDPARNRTTDPNEHTIEVLSLLNTSELTADEAYLARIAVLYHDVGKGRDSYDPTHPLDSARLAAPLLGRHDLSRDEQEIVLLHIRQHDLLGLFSRNRMTLEEAIARLQLVDHPRNLAIHYALCIADISAIRGLHHVIEEGRIPRARQELEVALART